MEKHVDAPIGSGIGTALRNAGEIAVLVAVSLTAIELAALDRKSFLPTEAVPRIGAITVVFAKNATLLLPAVVAALAAPGAARFSRAVSCTWALAVAMWVSSDATVRTSTGNALDFWVFRRICG